MRQITLMALLAFTVLGCRGQTSRHPPVHPNWNMDFQKRIDPQEAPPVILGAAKEGIQVGDGRGMRPQVPGTVARQMLGMHQARSLTEQERAWFDDPHAQDGRRADGEYATTFPQGLDVDRELLARGQSRYDIFCAPCHDKAGNSKGTVTQRTTAFAGLPSLHDPRVRELPVGSIYETIKNGRTRMPAYGPQIPMTDRWAIVAYVRALQLSQDASLEQVPADVRSAKGWQP
jgi:mono/diheme cytochrome c family protein